MIHPLHPESFPFALWRPPRDSKQSFSQNVSELLLLKLSSKLSNPHLPCKYLSVKILCVAFSHATLNTCLLKVTSLKAFSRAAFDSRSPSRRMSDPVCVLFSRLFFLSSAERFYRLSSEAAPRVVAFNGDDICLVSFRVSFFLSWILVFDGEELPCLILISTFRRLDGF